MKKRLILGSTSVYRRDQLMRLGVRFEVQAPQIDEESLKGDISNPGALCDYLALMKAQSLSPHFKDYTIIGGDQLVQFENQILGKPGSPEKAIEMLLKLSGKTHRLITSVCVLQGDQVMTHRDHTDLTMGHFDREFLSSYVKFDKSWDCSGAYKFEQGGQILFEKIVSEDYSAIVGLPLVALSKMLRKLGFTVFSLN